VSEKYDIGDVMVVFGADVHFIKFPDGVASTILFIRGYRYDMPEIKATVGYGFETKKQLDIIIAKLQDAQSKWDDV